MARKKYRGVEINAKYLSMAKHLDSLQELVDELRDLQSNWHNLSLLGELANIGTEISSTRKHFQHLANDLSDFLVEQATQQTTGQLAVRAQNSIDILVRNLFERTADIGFLATDPILKNHCLTHASTGLGDQEIKALRTRMQHYRSFYSVYSNVVLMDANCRVINDLTGKLEPGTENTWLKALVRSGKNYVEAYRPWSDGQHNPNELVYGWKIEHESTTVGHVALIFDLQEESKALFSKIIGKTMNNKEPQWQLCGVLDDNNRVLMSSNPAYIPLGQEIQAEAGKFWSLTQIGPVAYLVCIRTTRGYQGYSGPGWRGFCLVPLEKAFSNTGSGNHTIQIPHEDLSRNLIDARIHDIEQQALDIKTQLNRSIWNGTISHRNKKNKLGDAFSKTLLWEISKAGEATKKLFNESVSNMILTELTRINEEQANSAQLAIDLMDRNLYERANDCRWWALNPILADALLDTSDDERVNKATQCLKEINSLYTVYTNIILINRRGEVVTDSADRLTRGEKLNEPWIEKVHRLKKHSEYCVSDFLPSHLYDNRATYVYSAAIFNDSNNTLGCVALVFDSEPQFEAILNDTMGKCDSLAYITDTQGRVISSTTEKFIANDKLVLKNKDGNNFIPSQVEKAELRISQEWIAYGSCNSGSYREYKGEQDTYSNNLKCVFARPIGQTDTHKSNVEAIAFEQVTEHEDSTLVELGALRIGEQWFGIDSQDISEVFLCKHLVRMPNSMPYVVGTTLHQDAPVTILDLCQLLNTTSRREPSVEATMQLILLKTNDPDTQVALWVDELGEIPNIPISTIQECDALGSNTLIQGLVDTGNHMLVVVNVEQLIRQLQASNKKSPLDQGASLKLALA